jgi:hypothetical protein
MSPYLVMAFQSIWEWVLAPPLTGLQSLSHEWQFELAIALILVVFRDRLMEAVVVSGQLTGEWASGQKRRSEWYRIARMDVRTFTALIAALRSKAQKENRLAGRLDRNGEIMNGPRSRAAQRRYARAHALNNEADRLEALWQTIEQEREKAKEGPAARAEVLRLMRRLLSMDESTASGAFAELRRMGNSFRWDYLVPKELSAPQSERLLKVLRLMAGTTSLDEARTAYRSGLRILQDSGWGHYWEAA